MFLNGLIRANYKFDKTTKEKDKKFNFIENINIINEGIDCNSIYSFFLSMNNFKMKYLNLKPLKPLIMLWLKNSEIPEQMLQHLK